MGINHQFNEENPPIFHLNIINPQINENMSEQQNNSPKIPNSSFLQNNSQIFQSENKLSINIQIIDENTVNVKIPINDNQTWEKTYNKEELIETVIKDYSQENSLNIPLTDFNEIFFDDKKVKIDEKISNLLPQNNYFFNPYDIELNQNINKTHIELTPLNEKYFEVLGKPFYNPFEISCFYKSQKTFRILRYSPEIIEKTELINFGITSAYCNGFNNLYLSGGEDSLNNFWAINLKENIINDPIYMHPKKNHSMIYIPKSTVFIVDGNTLELFIMIS